MIGKIIGLDFAESRQSHNVIIFQMAIMIFCCVSVHAVEWFVNHTMHASCDYTYTLLFYWSLICLTVYLLEHAPVTIQ